MKILDFVKLIGLLRKRTVVGKDPCGTVVLRSPQTPLFLLLLLLGLILIMLDYVSKTQVRWFSMTELRVIITGKGDTQTEMGCFIKATKKTTQSELAMASALQTGLQVVMEEMAKMECLRSSSMVVIDNPSNELVRRMKARIGKE